MASYVWTRVTSYDIGLAGGPVAQYVGHTGSGDSVVRTRFGVSVSGTSPSDSPIQTVGRVLVGIGVSVHFDNSVAGSYTPPRPITDASFSNGPMNRWLYWAVMPMTLKWRDDQGLMYWEMAGGDQSRQSKGQVLANLPAGQGLDCYVGIETTEAWDPNGSLVCGFWAEMLRIVR